MGIHGSQTGSGLHNQKLLAGDLHISHSSQNFRAELVMLINQRALTVMQGGVLIIILIFESMAREPETSEEYIQKVQEQAEAQSKEHIPSHVE